jgi:hypothetical protein
MVSKSFENIRKLKYLGTAVTDQNFIQEEIKSRLNTENSFYHEVQNLVSFRLLSKNLKTKAFPVVWHPLVAVFFDHSGAERQ